MASPDPTPPRAPHGDPDADPDAEGPVVVDSLGTACPMPVIDLAAAVGEHPVGTTFRLLATDAAAKVDVPVWCRMQRQQLDDVVEASDHLEFLVTKVRATS